MKRLRTRLTGDVILLAVLLLLFAGFSLFIAIRQQQDAEQQENYLSYSSNSAVSSGTLGLYEWLGRLGYQTQRIQTQSFQISDDAHLLFIFNTNRSISSHEADYILQWVQRGNTLYVSQDSAFTTGDLNLSGNGLLQVLHVGLQNSSNISNIALTQPLIDASSGTMQTDTFSALQVNRNDYVEYANASGKPIIVRIPYGQGTVWVSSAADLFTNANLLNEDNAKFALAVVSAVPRGGTIAFDEVHLYSPFNSAGADQAPNIVYSTPWGWSIIFGIVLVFAYLVLNGRRFGRVIPVRKTLALRTPSEYVVSMANLFRRADKRGMILNHYRYALKRRLGRPFHLSPELSDERYTEMITRIRPEIDRAELTRILNSLRRTDTTEGDLVKTVDQAVKFGTR